MNTMNIAETPLIKPSVIRQASSSSTKSLHKLKNVDLEEFKTFTDKIETDDHSQLINESANTRANTIFSKNSTISKCPNISSKDITMQVEIEQILQEKVYATHEIVQKMRSASTIDIDFYNKYIKSSLLDLIKTRDGSESFQKRIEVIQQPVFDQLYIDVSKLYILILIFYILNF